MTQISSPSAAYRPTHGGYPHIDAQQESKVQHDAANCPRCLSVDPAFGPSPKDPAYRGPCPRCGERVPNSWGNYPGALSREDNETYVCSSCGQEEAFAAFYGSEFISPLGSYGQRPACEVSV